MLGRQITFAERYTLDLLRQRGCSAAAILSHQLFMLASSNHLKLECSL